MTKPVEINPESRKRQSSIRHSLLAYLKSNSPCGLEELIALFQYKVARHTIRYEVYRLESLGRIKYCPRTRTFFMPSSQREQG